MKVKVFHLTGKNVGHSLVGGDCPTGWLFMRCGHVESCVRWKVIIRGIHVSLVFCLRWIAHVKRGSFGSPWNVTRVQTLE